MNEGSEVKGTKGLISKIEEPKRFNDMLTRLSEITSRGNNLKERFLGAVTRLGGPIVLEQSEKEKVSPENKKCSLDLFNDEINNLDFQLKEMEVWIDHLNKLV